MAAPERFAKKSDFLLHRGAPIRPELKYEPTLRGHRCSGASDPTTRCIGGPNRRAEGLRA